MNNSSDPRDWTYVRKYTRPDIYIGRVFLYLIVVLFIIVLVRSITINIINKEHFILLTSVYLILLILVHINNICIWFVKCYQRFSPISVRSKCRYEPSCSEYMIQSIKKYGAFKGVPKGMRRLYRCSHGGGGFENP